MDTRKEEKVREVEVQIGVPLSVKFSFAEQLENAARLKKDAELILQETDGAIAGIVTQVDYPNNLNEKVAVTVDNNFIKGINKVIYSRWRDLSYDTIETEHGEISIPNPEGREIADGILADIRDHYRNDEGTVK